MVKNYTKTLQMGEQPVEVWTDAASIFDFKNSIRNGKVRGSLEILIQENGLLCVGDLRGLPASTILKTPTVGRKTANELKRLLGGNTTPVAWEDKKFVA